MIHGIAAWSVQSVVNHCVLIAMLSAGCKSLIVVWCMRVSSMLMRSNVCQMTHSARRFWTRCCCIVPAWSENCVSHLPMVASQIRYSTMQFVAVRAFEAKMMLLLCMLCSCYCIAWACHDLWPKHILYLGIVVQKASVHVVKYANNTKQHQATITTIHI